MDELFFLRSSKPEFHLHLETFHFERDMTFSTNCDYKVSKILANGLIESYINNELNKLECQQEIKAINRTKLTWTAPKSELIELIYAKVSASCFNYGNATLKQITEYFEDVFNVDLGANISRVFSDMRIRQNRTVSLDRLKDTLNKRMDEKDN